MTVRKLAEDVTTAATMFDPALTYYADGTDVMMVWDGGRKGRRGTAEGMAVRVTTYSFQIVRFRDGSVQHVAPHTLSRS